MYLVDTLHQRGIGVILDWVPSHFPTDEHGLAYFDGTHLFEHADPRQGHHPDWDSYIFNYGRNEVRASSCRSALFWLDVYHADGLRVDAVASMLYLDYSRKEGEWIPNEYGGRENLEAIAFLRQLNETVYREHPDVADHRRGVDLLADGVAADLRGRARLRDEVGHGLDARHARLHAPRPDLPQVPPRRAHVPDACTPSPRTSSCRSRTTRWCTGRARSSRRCRGDDWQKFANLRLLYAYMWAQPGKKLLFMGGEIAQRAGVEPRAQPRLAPARPGRARGRPAAGCGDLNRLMPAEPALHARDFEPGGFEWVDCNDAEHERALAAPPRRSGRRRHPGGAQLHAGRRAPTTAWACRAAAPGKRC